MKKTDALLEAFKNKEISNKVKTSINGGGETERWYCTNDSAGSDDYSKCDYKHDLGGVVIFDC